MDSSGDAYVTGDTQSSDFPTTAGAFQTTYGGGGDAFVTKLNSTGTALIYSTYLGGNGSDGGIGLAVDASGDAYVTGATSSANFPTTTGAYQTSADGAGDAFVAELNSNGTGLVYSTYLGGSGADNGYALAIDGGGNAYITGFTVSSNFPTTAGAYQTTPGGGGFYDAFVAKLAAGGSTLVYSTYLGGKSVDEGFGIAVDGSGDAYITGNTQSTNFPTTPDAFQSSLAGAVSAFVTKLNATGTALMDSTYLGGANTTQANGIALDSSGNAYIAGGTTSTDFPTTAGAYQTTYGGSGDAFVAKVSFSASPDTATTTTIALSQGSVAYGMRGHLHGHRLGDLGHYRAFLRERRFLRCDGQQRPGQRHVWLLDGQCLGMDVS